eukprot:254606-Pyramimonas_sp.AAC.1
MQDARSCAQRVYWSQANAASSIDAWAAAFQKMTDRRMMMHHPTDALAPVLVCLLYTSPSPRDRSLS